MNCMALTLLYCSQSSCCSFLRDLEVLLTQLIFPSVRWLPRRWGSFSPSLLPLRNASPFLIPFLYLSFFFCSTQSCQEFFVLFRGLSSSLSIQLMFCVSCFTCRCGFFFYVFVGEGERDLLLLYHLAPPAYVYDFNLEINLNALNLCTGIHNGHYL